MKMTTHSQNNILQKTRAQILTKPAPTSKHNEKAFSLLRFKLGLDTYAIESKYIIEVVGTSNITPLPGVPSFVVGLLFVQGKIWSVIDIRDFFNIPKQGISDHPRAILVETSHLRFGIMADSDLEIINTDCLSPLPDIYEKIPHNFIKGTINNTTIVLDLNTLSADTHLIVNN